MTGVPFETESNRPALPRPALSKDQKRELARFTGLVMASTVFFLTPLLVSPGRPAADPATEVVRSETGSAPLAAAPAVALASASAPARVRASRVPARSSAKLVAHSEPTRERVRGRRKGLSGTLMRALVGNGRHRVQPFPTPLTAD